MTNRRKNFLNFDFGSEKERKRQVQVRRRQDKPWVQWYRSPPWRKARAEYLGLHPYCEICGETSTVIDHVEPHQGNEQLFWEPSNWRPLCKRCHDSKTARKDGGFGNKKSNAPDGSCDTDGLPIDPSHPWTKKIKDTK